MTERLREAILRGHLKPGQRLDQNEIAEALNVSRSPVRDALRTLAVENLVELYPHRGAVVAELSPEELEEIYFIRGVLEGMAARLGAPKMDEDRIATVQTILEEMEKTSDLDRWLELNRRFHHTIYQVANRPRLLSIIENLRNTSAPYIRQFIAFSEHMAEARVSHRRIFEACANRDGLLAQEETQKHLKAVCEGVLVYVGSTLATA
ncbi:MAG: GntR family transcriptional regulator [Anaerolineae bacterium]